MRLAVSRNPEKVRAQPSRRRWPKWARTVNRPHLLTSESAVPRVSTENDERYWAPLALIESRRVCVMTQADLPWHEPEASGARGASVCFFASSALPRQAGCGTSIRVCQPATASASCALSRFAPLTAQGESMRAVATRKQALGKYLSQLECRGASNRQCRCHGRAGPCVA